MLKVYVACEFGRAKEAEEVARRLNELGFDVISTWHHVDTEYNPCSLSKAVRDYKQVMACDILVFLAGKSINANCELGIALGANKDVYVVGGGTGNLFLQLWQVTSCPSVNELLTVLDLVYGGLLK